MLPRDYLLLSIILKLTFVDCWITNINETMYYANMEENLIDDEMRTMNLIFPGTKWCGSGNIASNYDDLGESVETDKCCRSHDYCEDFIEGGESLHGLINDAFFTKYPLITCYDAYQSCLNKVKADLKLNCDCDRKFLRCLSLASEMQANIIGKIYFNILKTQCFEKQHPIVQCVHFSGWLIGQRCEEYKLDKTKPKIYQWFDVPGFAK